MHALFGPRCDAKEAADLDGPLHVRGVFCPCTACMEHDFSPGACEMRAELGAYKLEYAKRVVAHNPAVTRTQALFR